MFISTASAPNAMTVGERCWRPPVLGCSMQPIKSLAASKPSISDLLLRRLESARVVEGHGDLRPEHVCLGSTPRIIECLESRAELRLLDPSDELAFLAMECERLFSDFRCAGSCPYR
jgi:aminoglycoside phosphotransferase family enzyme